MEFLEEISSNLGSIEFRNFAVLFSVKPKLTVEKNKLKFIDEIIYKTVWGRGFKVSEGGFVQRNKHGKWFSWNRDGKLITTENFKEGMRNGPMIHWYLNGRKKMEVTYKDDKMDGPFFFWTEDGRYGTERTYKDNELVDYKGFIPE